jgi:hypothetical protein
MNHLPSHLITTQAHWDAMADILGDDEATKLYGSRPELTNTAAGLERLYLADKAPRRVLWAVVALSLVLVGSVAYRATHRADRAHIDPCALVLTRESGPECR